MSPECQQTPSRPCSKYAAAPNDVWSLGVILVNLTCGRNPWKKASPDDSTFRAFLKDPKFLSSILPISPELNMILRRIFECDPHKRISLQDLRDLIISCPRLTMNSYTTLPPSPPLSPYYPMDSMDYANMALPPSPPASPAPINQFQTQPSECSLFEPTSKQASSCSSLSTDSGYESDTPPFPGASQLILQPPLFNFYALPPNEYEKPYYAQPGYITAVTAF